MNKTLKILSLALPTLPWALRRMFVWKSLVSFVFLILFLPTTLFAQMPPQQPLPYQYPPRYRARYQPAPYQPAQMPGLALSSVPVDVPSRMPGVVLDPPWTQQLIKNEDRSFDFQTVAKGSRAEHRFILRNAFQETIRIAKVTSSCACTDVSIQDSKTELQTYEKAAIVAQFRADLFDGPKGATITVVIDKPYYAEFHLNVHGDIRSDVTLRPGNVRFDNIETGKEISRTVDVVYTGRNPAWKVLDFKSNSEHLTAAIEDVRVRPNRTTTKIRVKLDDATPEGKFSSRLYLVTNDQSHRREIPILVEATIGTTVTITPEVLFFGYLKPGEPSSRLVVLQGTKPFRIKNIDSDNPAVESTFTPSDGSLPKIKHIIPIKYANPIAGPGAPEDGKMKAVVKIETDLPGVIPELKVLMELAQEGAKDGLKKEKAAENSEKVAHAGL